MTLAQHHVIALALTLITTFCLGVLVLIADPRKRLNQIFCIYSLAIAWWACFEVIFVTKTGSNSNHFFELLEWPGVIFIAPTFLHTVALFTKDKGVQIWRVIKASYVVGLIFLLALFSGQLTGSLRPIAYLNHFHTLTTLGLCLPVFFVILVNYGLHKLLETYRQSEGSKRTQLKYLFWGSVIGYLGGGANWLLVLGVYIPGINPFGIYGVSLYSIATTYAVFQHRLFDFNLILRKSLVYSVLVTLLTSGYFSMVYVAEKIFQLTLGYKSIWTSLAAFSFMVIAFQPLKFSIQRFVDWILFGTKQENLIKRMERLEQETMQTEKLKAVSTLAAGLCHELRNPLQVIQTHVEFLPQRYDDPVFRKQYIQAVQTEVSRVNNLLKQLMDFSKPKEPILEPTEPHEVLNSTIDLLTNEFVKRGINLDKQYQASNVLVQVDPSQLRQVILNLVLNALQAIEQTGKIVVATSAQKGWFILEVKDSGPGIDPSVMQKLFEPFTTGKTGGTGLGLSVAQKIIKDHGGAISVNSQRNEGTTFTVKLPLN